LKQISRSAFLKGLAGCAVAAVSGKVLFDLYRPAPKVPCTLLGPSMALGHMIRDGRTTGLAADAPLEEIKVTIIGGGVAGLSAAWWLKKHGFDDFVLLEMEREVGGNSSSGKNAISAYPWGAHYVPLANQESEYVRMLFQELGVIQGFDANGLAIYNDLYMCHDPEERLLKDGQFQEGLVPKRGLQNSDKEDMKRFFGMMKQYRKQVGQDGKRAFAIPVDLSSQDADLLALDRLSMADWLKQNKFYGKPLLWYVDYCCRDDYGSSPEHVSAWAAIHYFAGRNGMAANADLNSVVTWPAGNGFLIERLREQLDPRIRTGNAVTRVSSVDGAVQTVYMEPSGGAVRAVKSEYAICATPRFLTRHLMGEHGSVSGDITYAPWMVANISVKRVPEARGVGLAWDNVSYSSKSLGYVVATHQNITTQKNAPTVITYYYPIAEKEPSDARRELLSVSKDDWSGRILADLEKMHPGITSDVISMELWPWGHGMIRPSVGFIWGETRRKMKENRGNIYFAHSDMSGISNFEEAQYQGVQAAQSILAKLGIG